MNNEEKLKRNLQEKIESKEFAFDESEWEKAAAIIDASRNSGNKSMLYILSGALFLLLSYISYNVITDFKTTVKGQELSATNTLISERRLLAENGSSPISMSDVKESVSSVPKNHSEPLQTKVPNEPIVTKTKKISNPSPVVETPKKEIAQTTKQTNTQSENPVSNSEPVLQSNASTSTYAESSEEPQSPSNTNPIVKTDPKEIPSPDKNTTALIVPAVLAFATPPTLNNETIKTALETNETSVSASMENQIAASAVEDTNTKASSEVVKENTVQVVAQNTVTISQEKSETDIHNILNFELGGSYLFGWKNPEGKDAAGLNAVVGLNYLSNVHENYWFSLGVQYTTVRNLSYSSKTSKVTRYRLGEESDVTTITPSTIHYICFPFKLQYQLNEKNSFGLGYTANYLLNVESKVERYTETFYTTENHQTYTTGGYTEGFKLFTSQAAVFYRRQLLKNIWINADFVFGLNDIKENSFFNSNNIERNTGIKLTLTYNLFNH